MSIWRFASAVFLGMAGNELGSWAWQQHPSVIWAISCFGLSISLGLIATLKETNHGGKPEEDSEDRH